MTHSKKAQKTSRLGATRQTKLKTTVCFGANQEWACGKQAAYVKGFGADFQNCCFHKDQEINGSSHKPVDEKSANQFLFETFGMHASWKNVFFWKTRIFSRLGKWEIRTGELDKKNNCNNEISNTNKQIKKHDNCKKLQYARLKQLRTTQNTYFSWTL